MISDGEQWRRWWMGPRVGAAFGAVAAVTLLIGCADDGPAAETAPPPSTSSTTGPATRACVAPTFRLEYPATWHVNDADEAAACRWFHHRPFELPEATDVVALAVHLRYEPRTVDELVGGERGEVIDRRDEAIGDRRAVRVHARAGGDGLLPARTETVSWYLDTGPRTLVATTSDTARQFSDNVMVLDSMIESIHLTINVACSAVGLHVHNGVGGDIPEAVLRTRDAILTAAVACDYATLGELARSGNQTFSFSFGGAEDPAAFWRAAERSGEEPLRLLVQILGLAHAERGVDDDRHFIWPAAHDYEDWDAVPAEHRNNLRRLYSAEVIETFDQTGAYLGHRVGIDDAGGWLYFIAGD